MFCKDCKYYQAICMTGTNIPVKNECKVEQQTSVVTGEQVNVECEVKNCGEVCTSGEAK